MEWKIVRKLINVSLFLSSTTILAIYRDCESIQKITFPASGRQKRSKGTIFLACHGKREIVPAGRKKQECSISEQKLFCSHQKAELKWSQPKALLFREHPNYLLCIIPNGLLGEKFHIAALKCREKMVLENCKYLARDVGVRE
jgi:hypothetical protein